eukprot:1383356-Amphidinium_carterae.5
MGYDRSRSPKGNSANSQWISRRILDCSICELSTVKPNGERQTYCIVGYEMQGANALDSFKAKQHVGSVDPCASDSSLFEQ